jgi:hypothetical protein
MYFAICYLHERIEEVGSEDGGLVNESEWIVWGKNSHVVDAIISALRTKGYSSERGYRPASTAKTSQSLLSRVGTLINDVFRAVLGMARTAKFLIAAYYRAHRQARSASTTLSRQWNRAAKQGRPRVLILTQYPHSWQEIDAGEGYPEGVTEVDRYFADTPWRLQQAGLCVGWLPVLSGRPSSGQAEQRWQHRTTAGIPDALPWMKVHWSVVPTIFWNMVGFCLRYLWTFSIQKRDRTIFYGDLPLGHWIREEYRHLSHFAGAPHLFQIESFRSVIEALQPDVILYRNEFFVVGRQIAAAGQGRTHLLAVQHGMMNREDTVYQFHPSEIMTGGSCELKDSSQSMGPHIHHCPVPDAIAVFGTETVRWFDQWGGYPADRLVVTGGLRHDRLMDRYVSQMSASKRSKRRRLREELGWPADDHVVLLCTGYIRDVRTWCDMTASACQSTGMDLHLAIKPHPYHGGSEIAVSSARDMGLAAYSVTDDGDIYKQIAAADVLVTGVSTVVIESILIGTPVVMISAHSDYSLYPSKSSTTPEGWICVGADAAVLSTGILKALRSDLHDKPLEISKTRKFLHNADGQAVRRLVSHIRSAVRPRSGAITRNSERIRSAFT